MIKLKGVTFGYKKSKPVLKNISLSFKEGMVTSVLGRNGCGKSTMLKSVNGIIKPESGEVFVDSRPLKDYDRKELARVVGFMAQRSSGIDATVFDAVITGRRPYMGLSLSSEDREITEEIISLMGLDKMACRRTTEISGGELQKVVIARALVQQPKIMLLDEPVNHLDMVNQLEVLSFIREITEREGITTVIVMHDINMAIRFSDELIFMKDGQFAGACEPAEITSELIKDTFGLGVRVSSDGERPYIIPE